ncbi:hypothetical protein [Microbacterium sp. K24]|jgi:hypothetical protein|uniref:hypothetical protein n=1 Tax=Microbacterium sp. K24 TaxID=2305446 RepID=UPI00109D7FEB|nr:hypothetical protein [Microbacterium sp. K24]
MSVRTPVPTGSETHVAHEADAPSDAAELTHHLIDFDRYVITRNGPIGYVEVVAPVFVCYLGHPYAQAEEIAQVLEFERAVQIVAEQATLSQRPKLAT